MEPSIPEFYRGKFILITGGTGFIGKSLLEKLLRSLPEIKTIYLLLRQKKGISSEDRLRELCRCKIFDVLHQQNPNAFDKVKLISGDITAEGLGISDHDRELLIEECQIIFHSAACVRFDMKLKDAVNLNVTATYRMLSLAETMKNLEAFVHLSTAYCRCYLNTSDEKLYPAVHSPRKIIDLVEWMDDKTLDYLEPKLIASEPNTYSYTKAITEELVGEYSQKFPIAIARPSIVTASWKEPFPGWVDNLNGATGIIVGSGKGVIKSMLCEGLYNADHITVDVVANSCILIAKTTALKKSKEVQVYHLTLSHAATITWGSVVEIGKKWLHIYPFTIAMWYTTGTMKSSWFVHQLCVVFLHMLPAYLIDGLLYLFGQKPFMINVQKRVNHGINILQYYTTKEWHFKNENFRALSDNLNKQDGAEFFTDYYKLDLDEYIKNYVIGVRRYVCKEDDSTLPRARRNNLIRYALDRFVKVMFIFTIIWYIYIYSFDLLSTTSKGLHSVLNYINPLQTLSADTDVTVMMCDE